MICHKDDMATGKSLIERKWRISAEPVSAYSSAYYLKETA